MRTFAWAVMLVLAVSCRAAEPPGGALTGERYRLLVSSDIGGSDPDDIQSMIHLMFYADLFDIEGLVASRPAKAASATF
ncbi:hypothetical protein HS125_18690 [bacterium]|nr:hypothetical protein [bacterium]